MSADLLKQVNGSLNMLAFGENFRRIKSDRVPHPSSCLLCCTDIATSEASTAPYHYDDTQKLLSVTRDIQGDKVEVLP